jgi:hypothetical protein
VNDRLVQEKGCVQPIAVTSQVVLSPVLHIEVHAQCTLSAPLFGGNFGLTQITADASMPIDVSATQ